ncbi:hypothetical protein [Shewanella xiamenensis]|uniref:hypothetical protein n=1 Tax=Shewanella xiamenensis TaxID=332186 RepID=UPI001185056B|nr:hypothetical protein [Shewanella xiamenensis]TVL28645.1 hypothetical protein AYI95_16875 [Shewanella xiamenensis]
MKVCRCVYFDKKNSRFAIYVDEQYSIGFLYWSELYRQNITELEFGQCFKASFGNREGQSINFRGHSVFDATVELDSRDKVISFSTDLFKVVSKLNIDQNMFLNLIEEYSKIVFIECDFSNLQIKKYKITSSVAFLGCNFNNNFRLIECKIYGNLWMPSCRFQEHFSLKNTSVNGSVHLESCNFSGLGGVSLRGLKADNLYLDLGVIGGDDLFWLNEMNIEGVVSLGGRFNNDIQFLGYQDKSFNLHDKPKIGSIIIGVEVYEGLEQSNVTNLSSKLIISSYEVSGVVSINNLSAELIFLNDISAGNIIFNDISTVSDLKLSFCNSKGGVNFGGIKVINSSIGRHLKVDNCNFSNILDFSNTAVSEVSYLNNNETSAGKVSIKHFTSSRFIVYPESFLFGNSRSSIFYPKEFDVLVSSDNIDLGDQYCSLKNWMADSGKLELEDIAYFNMRQCYHENELKKFFFGRVFGWGVRLSNIGISSFVLILLFSFFYRFMGEGLGLFMSLSLSLQSFISSFFGQWAVYKPDGLIAYVVTFESFWGVLFITVFIGAYIRKLLR